MTSLNRIFAMLLIAAAGQTAIAGTPVKQTELPEAAQTFITKYFAADHVRKAEADNGRRGVEYEVDFSSGAEVEFTADGNWKEVKAAKGTAVPAAIVPAAIAKYVSANFEGLTIVEIARKRGGYEVELSNSSELHLTEDAKPMQPRQQGNRQQGGNRRHN